MAKHSATVFFVLDVSKKYSIPVDVDVCFDSEPLTNISCDMSLYVGAVCIFNEASYDIETVIVNNPERHELIGEPLLEKFKDKVAFGRKVIAEENGLL